MVEIIRHITQPLVVGLVAICNVSGPPVRLLRNAKLPIVKNATLAALLNDDLVLVLFYKAGNLEDGDDGYNGPISKSKRPTNVDIVLEDCELKNPGTGDGVTDTNSKQQHDDEQFRGTISTKGVDLAENSDSARFIVFQRMVERKADHKECDKGNYSSSFLPIACCCRSRKHVLFFGGVLSSKCIPGARNRHEEVHPGE